MTLQALKDMYRSPDKDPIEVAKCAQALVRELGTQQEASRQTGIASSIINHHLSLLLLPDELQAAISEGKLKFKSGRALADLHHREDILDLAKPFMDGTFSSSPAERYVKLAKEYPHMDAQSLVDAIQGKAKPIQPPEPVAVPVREPEPMPEASDVFGMAMQLRAMLMTVELGDSIDALRARSELKRLLPVVKGRVS